MMIPHQFAHHYSRGLTPQEQQAQRINQLRGAKTVNPKAMERMRERAFNQLHRRK